MHRSDWEDVGEHGWIAGEAADFLALSETELRVVEMKISLGFRLRELREEQNLTQAEVANRMGSSQSRVAKMEAGDPNASLDLFVVALLEAGATKCEIASALAGEAS